MNVHTGTNHSTSMKKDVSAREMSSLFGTKQQLYQSYRKQESVAFSGMLFCICDYFGITPREFFDEATPLPGTQRYHRGFEILGTRKLLATWLPLSML